MNRGVHSTDGRRPFSRTERGSGFTLVEMMVGMCIASIIMLGIVSTYIFSLKGYQAVANYREIHAAGRKAVDRFARDVRGVNAITTFNSSTLGITIPTTFSSFGGVTASKTVRYNYLRGALYRYDSSTTNTEMLATNIYSLTWRLYDHLGSNTTVLSTAKGISIDIKLRKFVISQIQSEDYLSARLDMRNK